MTKTVTELGVARAIATGKLPSPTQFYNAAFYALRISGTGAAWRASIKEFVWREPKIWLSPEMQDRVRGLPVVWQHPKEGELNSETFGATVVGTIIFAFVLGNELWGVARVLDKRAAALLDSGEYDTSPAVLFAPKANETIEVRGERLLVEGVPMLTDHLAIVDRGVWAKGLPDNSGVELTESERTAT